MGKQAISETALDLSFHQLTAKAKDRMANSKMKALFIGIKWVIRDCEDIKR